MAAYPMPVFRTCSVVCNRGGCWVEHQTGTRERLVVTFDRSADTIVVEMSESHEAVLLDSDRLVAARHHSVRLDLKPMEVFANMDTDHGAGALQQFSLVVDLCAGAVSEGARRLRRHSRPSGCCQPTPAC